jgi:hypothetical protein
VAVLNCCSKEELDELDEEPAVPATPATPGTPATATSEEAAERRKVIKNKIMAVGRMSRVFALLREESERVSELKNVSGSTKLPYGTLASGAEGIKDAITSFDDACAPMPRPAPCLSHALFQPTLGHRERTAAARPRRRRLGGGQGALLEPRDAAGRDARRGAADARRRAALARRALGPAVRDLDGRPTVAVVGRVARVAADAGLARRARRLPRGPPPAGKPRHDQDEPEHAPAQPREHRRAHQGGRRRRGRAGGERVGEARGRRRRPRRGHRRRAEVSGRVGRVDWDRLVSEMRDS